jgi:hypothetical protein
MPRAWPAGKKGATVHEHEAGNNLPSPSSSEPSGFVCCCYGCSFALAKGLNGQKSPPDFSKSFVFPGGFFMRAFPVSAVSSLHWASPDFGPMKPLEKQQNCKRKKGALKVHMELNSRVQWTMAAGNLPQQLHHFAVGCIFFLSIPLQLLVTICWPTTTLFSNQLFCTRIVLVLIHSLFWVIHPSIHSPIIWANCKKPNGNGRRRSNYAPPAAAAIHAIPLPSQLQLALWPPLCALLAAKQPTASVAQPFFFPSPPPQDGFFPPPPSPPPWPLLSAPIFSVPRIRGRQTRTDSFPPFLTSQQTTRGNHLLL